MCKRKTVYFKCEYFISEKERKTLRNNLQKESGDRIVIVPSCLHPLNANELEVIPNEELLGSRKGTNV